MFLLGFKGFLFAFSASLKNMSVTLEGRVLRKQTVNKCLTVLNVNFPIENQLDYFK